MVPGCTQPYTHNFLATNAIPCVIKDYRLTPCWPDSLSEFLMFLFIQSLSMFAVIMYRVLQFTLSDSVHLEPNAEGHSSLTLLAANPNCHNEK